MKRLLLYIFFLCTVSKLFSQDKEIQGIVFDSDTKQRLARVYIYNTRIHKGFYNNSKGEFRSAAREGDVLVAALEGYAVDTIKVRTQATLIFHLKRNTILLDEVTIRDTSLTPQQRLKRAQQENQDAYRKGDTKDLLQVGGPNGLGGAGLGIDALWNLLSREGKNARFLQKIIERDYREQLIKYRYTPALVRRVTGLTDEKLQDFMLQYRPSYDLALEASDYVLINFIKSSYQQYKRNPAAYRLPSLSVPN